MNKKYPLITVIIPVYNIEKYIKKCIDSIIRQSYKNLEIIIVDDGSTDNSLAICNQYYKEYNNVHIIHKQNGGLSDARNYGLRYATGDYICFVDGDDYIDKRMVETMFLQMENNKADISIIDYRKVNSYDDFHELRDSNYNETEILKPEDAIKRLFNDNSFGNYAWNKMYKKELFNNVKYPVGKNMEDLGTTYLLFLQCNKIVYFNEKLYYYVQRDGSILHTENQKLIFDKVVLSIERYIYISKIYPNMEENKRFIYNILMQYYHNIIDYPQISSYTRTILKKNNLEIFKLLSLKNKIKYVFLSLNDNLYLKIRKI